MESSVLFAPSSYSGLLPEFAVFGGIILNCLLIFLIPRFAAAFSVWISIFSLGFAFFYSFGPGEKLPSALEHSFWTGTIKQYFCVSASVLLFGWLEWKQERKLEFSPIFSCLVLTSVLSLMILVQASELWMMILSAEAFSFSAYALAAGNTNQPDSARNILRYFGIGALATGFSVFGLSWMKGFEGDLFSASGSLSGSMVFFPIAGTVFFLAFIFFKLGCFPFQSWISGIFTCSATPVAGFLASAPKVAAGFVCLNLVQIQDVNLSFPFVFLALVTGILGNLAAFRSRDAKEMLAFSAVGQASFLVIPSIFSRQVSGAESQLLYFALSYGTAVQAAFSAIQYFENHLGDRILLEDFSAESRLHPVPALLFCALLLSIIGIPPFAGFTAKMLVISGLPAGSNLFPSGWLYALYFSGLLSTIMAAGYFLRIPYQLYFGKTSNETANIRPSAVSLLVMASGVIFQLAMFFFPSFFS